MCHRLNGTKRAPGWYTWGPVFEVDNNDACRPLRCGQHGREQTDSFAAFLCGMLCVTTKQRNHFLDLRILRAALWITWCDVEPCFCRRPTKGGKNIVVA
jgi:hypothetical protein